MLRKLKQRCKLFIAKMDGTYFFARALYLDAGDRKLGDVCDRLAARAYREWGVNW